MILDRLLLGPWRRRRRMMRALRELDRLDAGLPPRRAPVLRRLLSTVAVVALIGAFVLNVAHQRWGVTLTADGLTTPHRLSPPASAPSGPGAFQFTMTQPHDASRPVTYDPCRPIEYEVNDALQPRGARRILTKAVAAVEQATGLRFQYVARTADIPFAGAAPYSARREPVVVARTTPEIRNELAGRVAGLGGSTPAADQLTGQLEYVTGGVNLDAPDLTSMLAQPGGDARVRAIAMHELGHVVGLAHVTDPNELMADDNHGRLDFGPGDRQGLAALGSGSCSG